MERRVFLGGIAALGATAVSMGPTRAQEAPVGRSEWDAAGREPVDLAALTEDELVHVPVLTLPSAPRVGRAFDLAVQIGVTPHEATAEHRIDWIDVRLEDAALVGRSVFCVDLSADVPYPVVRVPLVLSAAATLVVRARCTQHGVWVTRRAITPT